MKFDQIMEKVDIEYSGSDFEYLIFNIDEEERIEYQYGHKWCRRNDKLHRADGPAIERSDGSKYWYLNGKRYSEKDFNEKVKNEI